MNEESPAFRRESVNAPIVQARTRRLTDHEQWVAGVLAEPRGEWPHRWTPPAHAMEFGRCGRFGLCPGCGVERPGGDR